MFKRALRLPAAGSETFFLWGPRHLRGLRNLVLDHPKVRHRIVVCLEANGRKTEDGLAAPRFTFRALDPLSAN
jgi:hypothetical protein